MQDRKREIAAEITALLGEAGADVIVLPTPVLNSDEVGKLLKRSGATFLNNKAELEANGFPKKLPGINGWSRGCVLRWIETNGETYLPAEPAGPSRLERAYGGV